MKPETRAPCSLPTCADCGKQVGIVWMQTESQAVCWGCFCDVVERRKEQLDKERDARQHGKT